MIESEYPEEDNELIEESYNTTNSNDYSNATALSIRLDNSNIIEQIEMFLKSEVVTLSRDKNDEIKSKRKKIGEPRANTDGIGGILLFLQNIINNGVVQGNFASSGQGVSKYFEDYIYYNRRDLSKVLVVNKYKWGIDSDDIEFIVDSLMNIIEPFMTRLIDNKERDSYSGTIQYSESPKQEKQGGFNLFGRN